MEPLSEQIRKLNLKKTNTNNYNNAELVDNDQDSLSIHSQSSTRMDCLQRKVGPSVPPKPFKKAIDHPPQVPQSKYVNAEAIVPLYSRPLQSEESFASGGTSKLSPMNSIVRKHLLNETLNNAYQTKSSESTLDNPLVLEQQLEALAYHKQQMEKKGLLAGQRDQQTSKHSLGSLSPMSTQLKLSSNSLVSFTDQSHNSNYSNMRFMPKNSDDDMKAKDTGDIYNNIKKQLRSVDHNLYKSFNANTASGNSNVYSNVFLQKGVEKADLGLSSETLPLKPSLKPQHLSISTNAIEQEDDIPPPPSPVSSSYSELRRATEIFATSTNGGPTNLDNSTQLNTTDCNSKQKSYTNNYNIQYSPAHQSSSAYDSIYEPINPRPPSNMLSRANYLMYVPYVNGSQIPSSATASANLSTIGNINSSGTNTPVYVGNSNLSSINMALPPTDLIPKTSGKYQKEENVEVFSDLLANSVNQTNEVEHYGKCFKCNERVLGENTGCTAMDQIYHIACFTCWECQINLQGKPFYALEGKPYCQYDYLQTLEKCSVCMKPILERILRATGKPYHPQCFTCVICNRSLDGIPFTVDATNQNYCITDFHKKFAPRCCVCKDPIMPDPGQEETIRVVALDRSFHLECYKCEDCGLLLSSEAEGRGCYPLDDHIFCKSCNAKRVQLLTNTMTTEL